MTDFRAHDHLWALFDGTPAHAPPGRLTVSEMGHVACHLCGRWFVRLGPHLRSHGWSAARYRAAVGLTGDDPLTGSVTDTSSPRQRAARARDRHLLGAESAAPPRTEQSADTG